MNSTIFLPTHNMYAKQAGFHGNPYNKNMKMLVVLVSSTFKAEKKKKHIKHVKLNIYKVCFVF